MPDSTTVRLIEVLKKCKKNSWESLAQSISSANNNERKVDRRKLKRLCEGDESVTFSITELRALDTYLIRHNEGLAENPLFTRSENILDSLVESDFIQFIVSAKYQKEIFTEAVSRWDMKAVIRLINSRLGSLGIDVKEIPEYNEYDAIDQDDKVYVNRDRSLNSVVSNVSIASPLANPVSEAFLAKMLNIPPNKRKPYDPERKLPFYFFYPEAGETFPSTFFLNKEDVKKLIGDKKFSDHFQSPKTRGLIIGRDVYADNRTGKNHALLVAQRKDNSNGVRMVLSGISAPATYGLAKAIAKGKINACLPKLEKIEFQKILVAVVEVDITELGENTNIEPNRDSRKISDIKIVKQPIFFDPKILDWI